MCLCLCGYRVHEYGQVLSEARGVRGNGDDIVGDCEPPDVGIGKGNMCS